MSSSGDLARDVDSISSKKRREVNDKDVKFKLELSQSVVESVAVNKTLNDVKLN
jgi:hypothetical protein